MGIDAGTSSIAFAVGWTLAHAAWQSTLAWLIFAWLRGAASTAAARSRTANIVLLCFAAAQCITLALCLFGPARERFVGALARPAPPERLAQTDRVRVDSRAAEPGALATLADRAEPAIPWLAGAWCLGTLACVAGTARSWQRTDRTIAAARPVRGAWASRLRTLARRLPRPSRRRRRAVRFVESADVSIPFTTRWRRPVVVLPTDAGSTLPQPMLEAVVLHELAHIARDDVATTVLRDALADVYCFLPPLRAITACAIDDSEEATDDLAATILGDRRAMAAALVELAAVARSVRPVGVSAAGGSLRSRVARLVRPVPTRPRMARRASFAGAAIAGLLAVATIAAAAGESASHRAAYTWLRSRDLCKAVVDTVASDRDNPDFASAMRNAIEELHAPAGLPGDEALARLAAAASSGVPVRAVDDLLTPLAVNSDTTRATLRGLAHPDFGTVDDRRRLVAALMAVSDERSRIYADASRDPYATAAVLVASLDLLADDARELVRLLHRADVYPRLGLSAASTRKLSDALLIHQSRVAIVLGAMTGRELEPSADDAVVDALSVLPARQVDWAKYAAAATQDRVRSSIDAETASTGRLAILARRDSAKATAAGRLRADTSSGGR